MKYYIGNKIFEEDEYGEYCEIKSNLTRLNKLVSKLETEYRMALRMDERSYTICSQTVGTPCFRAYMETVGFSNLELSKEEIIKHFEEAIAQAKSERDMYQY